MKRWRQARLAAKLQARQIGGAGVHLDGETDGIDQFPRAWAAKHLTAAQLQGLGGKDARQ